MNSLRAWILITLSLCTFSAKANMYEVCTRFFGYLSPTINAALDEAYIVEMETEERGNRKYYLEKYLGVKSFRNHPRFGLLADRGSALGHFRRAGITPEKLFHQLGDRYPKAIPVIEELLEKVRVKGKALSWTLEASTSSSSKIELSMGFIQLANLELSLLPTLAHELAHDPQFPPALPSEAKSAYVTRVSKILEADEMAAIDAGIATAIRLDELNLGKAQHSLGGASLIIYQVRQKKFRNPALARKAEILALRAYADSYYPRYWKNYLEARWEALQQH